jgi:methionine-rich copper-binding protein CopC
MKKLLVFSALFLVLIPSLVLAHVYLLECDPPQDAELSTPPEKIRLTFVGSIEPAFSKVEVFNQSNEKVSKKTAFYEDDTVMEVELHPNLGAGTYTVKWKCMSLDSHKQTGEYTFLIK